MSLMPISHSMADAYASCQKKFEYAHIEKLMPMQMPEALARGTYGHKAVEMFFTRIKEGADIEEAKATALVNAMDNPRYYNQLWNRIEHFIDVIYPTLGWEEILDIEHKYRLDVSPSGYQFPFTVDLVVRLADGTTRVVDFKFGSDAYSDDLAALYPQIPKYVGALGILANAGLLGYPAPTSAVYVFIRSRQNIADVNKFIETMPVRLSPSRIKNSFIEQDRTSRAILDHIALDGKPFLRAFNNNCKFCPFLDLCVASVNGRDTEYEAIKETLYTANTYGYDVEEVV